MSTYTLIGLSILIIIVGFFISLTRKRIVTRHYPQYPNAGLDVVVGRIGIAIIVVGLIFLAITVWNKCEMKQKYDKTIEWLTAGMPKTNAPVEKPIIVKEEGKTNHTTVVADDHVLVGTNIPSTISIKNDSGNVSVILNSPHATVTQSQSMSATRKVKDPAHKRDLEAERKIKPQRILPPDSQPEPVPQVVVPPKATTAPCPTPTRDYRIPAPPGYSVPSMNVCIERVVSVSHISPFKWFSSPEHRTYIYGIKFYPLPDTKLTEEDLNRDLHLMLSEFADRKSGALRDDDDYDYPANPDKQMKFRQLFSEFLKESHEEHDSVLSHDWLEWMAINGTGKAWFSFPNFDQNLIPGI